MADKIISVQTDYQVFSCGCGAVYALPLKFVAELKETHKTFFCPKGCRRWFPKDNEEEKLRKQNDQLKQQLNAKEEFIKERNRKIDHLFRSKRAHKANYTRLKTKYHKVKSSQ